MFRDTNRGKIVEKLCDVSSSKRAFFTDLHRKDLSAANDIPPTPLATSHYKPGYILELSRQSGIHKGLWAQTTPCFSLFPPQIVENRGKQTDCTPPCNRPHGPFRLLAIPLSSPSFSLQRKPCRPRRQLAHQLAQLLDGTKSPGNLGYEFVMHM